MAEQYIMIKVDNEKEILVRLTEVEERAKEKVKGVIGGAAHYALYWMRLYAHVSSGYTLRHIDATGVRPVADSRGAEWEAVAGVRRGDRPTEAIYAEEFGSGIYVGKGYITARGTPRFSPDELDEMMSGDGKPFAGMKKMNLQKRGEKRKAIPYQKGQRPQRFVYLAMTQTKLYLNARVATLGREIAFP